MMEICRNKDSFRAKMAYYTRIFCFVLFIFKAAEPKWIRPLNINKIHCFKYKFNKIKISVKDMTIINDNNKDIEAIINKTDHPVSLSESEKKCEIINQTEESFEVKHVESIRLDNMNSVTVDLIKGKVSIDDIEVDGVNLFDVVNSNCGSAKICPNFRVNWTDTNTVTIGFLSAYGWSQRLSQSNVLVVTAEHHFPDYIPRHISRLESIVDQTYDKTRAIGLGSLGSETLSLLGMRTKKAFPNVTGVCPLDQILPNMFNR